MLSLSAILRDPPPDPELREMVDRVLGTWSTSLGLVMTFEGTRTDEPPVTIDAWTDEADPTIEVDLVYDDELRCRYLSAISDDEELRRRMFERLRLDFAVEAPDALCDAVQREGDSDPA